MKNYEAFKKTFAKNNKQLEKLIINRINIIKNIKNNNKKHKELHSLFKDVFRAVVFRNKITGKKYCDNILKNEKFGKYILKKTRLK